MTSKFSRTDRAAMVAYMKNLIGVTEADLGLDKS